MSTQKITNKISVINGQILDLKMDIKVIEAYDIIEETYSRRDRFMFISKAGTKVTLWSEGLPSSRLWSCGELQFSSIKHYKDMYKLCKGVAINDPVLDKFIKAENFIKKALTGSTRDKFYNLLRELA